MRSIKELYEQYGKKNVEKLFEGNVLGKEIAYAVFEKHMFERLLKIYENEEDAINYTKDFNDAVKKVHPLIKFKYEAISLN